LTKSNESRSIEPPSVFDYLDYHTLLRDWFESKKAQRASYSFQELANRAGMKSRSFLRLVAIGERDVLHAAAVRLSQAMNLTDKESEYFLALVGYNNASDPWERSLYLNKLKAVQKPTKPRLISTQQFRLFSDWYIIPIWEIVVSTPFGNDFKMLGQKLTPEVRPEDAREAVSILLELELIEPDGDKYRQKELVLHTKDELVSKTIKSYQIRTIDLARDALESMAPEIRNIGTLTLGLDEPGWETAKSLIQEFRQKMIDLGARVASADRVYQVNVQAFPLTKLYKPEDT